jgi:hypothetical protein
MGSLVMGGQTGIFRVLQRRRFYMHPAHATIGVSGARAWLQARDPGQAPDRQDEDDRLGAEPPERDEDSEP